MKSLRQGAQQLIYVAVNVVQSKYTRQPAVRVVLDDRQGTRARTHSRHKTQTHTLSPVPAVGVGIPSGKEPGFSFKVGAFLELLHVEVERRVVGHVRDRGVSGYRVEVGYRALHEPRSGRRQQGEARDTTARHT